MKVEHNINKKYHIDNTKQEKKQKDNKKDKIRHKIAINTTIGGYKKNICVCSIGTS